MKKNCLGIAEILFVWVFILALSCPPAAAQCPEVEAVLKDIITKEIETTVTSREYDTYQKVSCYTLGEMSADDFILLGRGLEYSDITKQEPGTVEYNVLRMVNREKGVACEHIFIKRKKSNPVNYRTYNQFQRQRIANLLKAKEDNLALLKKQQQYLTTDILNILGDVLVGQIDAPGPFSDVVSDASKELKDLGIKQVSKYYEIEYTPSENETANLVRKIIDPIDKAISVSGVSMGKWLKYWEALKLSPDGGMVIGNVAAKVRIYFMENELQEDIEKLKKRLAEIPSDEPSNVYTGTSEERTLLR